MAKTDKNMGEFVLLKKIFLWVLLFTISYSQTQQSSSEDKITLPEKTEFTNTLIAGLGNDAVKNEQANYVLYYKKGSYTEENVDKLIPMIESAVKRVKYLLGISKLSEGFYLVMIDSRDEMERIINWNVKALASGRNDAAIFVYNQEIRPYFKHELFHLIAFNIWGEPAERILDEGGAMYSDNQCLYYENPLSTINKYLYEDEKWFKVDELINNFNEKTGENDLIAYLQAGYIFRHLYENYGKEKMKQLWGKGFTDFKQIYGFNINELAARIKEEMKEIKSTKVDWDELMDKGCG